MLPLLFAFRNSYQTQHMHGSQWALALGIVGAIIASLNQVIFILKVTDLRQSILGSSVGNGLIGLAILLFSIYSLADPNIPRWLAIFGIVLGSAMALGLILGTFFLDDIYALSTGALDYANMKPFMVLVMFAAAINQVGLPVWLLIFGIKILNRTINM